MTIASKRFCDICNDCQTTMRCDTSLELPMRFLLRLSRLHFFDAIFCVGICNCAIFDHFDFSSNFELYVTLVQKLRRPKSFFGEIEFLAPSFAGSTLTPNTLLGKIYRRFRELCVFFKTQKNYLRLCAVFAKA